MRYSNGYTQVLMVGSLLISVLVGCTAADEAEGTPQSSVLPVSPVIAAPALIDKVTFVPARPRAGEAVRAVVQTRYSRPGSQLRYEWRKNRRIVTDVNGAVFPANQTTVGDQLGLKVTPYDELGDEPSLPSSYVVIRPPASEEGRGVGHPCKHDTQCASGSCGIGEGGMRCIGRAPSPHQETAPDAEMPERLEHETTFVLHETSSPIAAPRHCRERKRSAFRDQEASTRWTPRNDWGSSGGRSSGIRESNSEGRDRIREASFGSGSAPSSASSGLGVGADCSQDAACGTGLVCTEAEGMSTCVPSGR